MHTKLIFIHLHEIPEVHEYQKKKPQTLTNVKKGLLDFVPSFLK